MSQQIEIDCFIDYFQEISHTHNKYEAVPIVLIGNKADLEGQRQVRLKDGAKVIKCVKSVKLKTYLQTTLYRSKIIPEVGLILKLFCSFLLNDQAVTSGSL